jgi:hypothetical protein
MCILSTAIKGSRLEDTLLVSELLRKNKAGSYLKKKKKKKALSGQGKVEHAFSPSTREVKAGRSL